ncbi:hypothetical protein QN277_003882 [Acacia crassicarpa]|uniref:Wall-associated receptor kinase C-terminal domain-containing protein n=1 Tax=Acacia crassicarpa TaxID=499986 RepID=A0AAE1MD75_9FABA|nr:hypothetical protein QN277_003882 [Acacia crassicarpa]
MLSVRVFCYFLLVSFLWVGDASKCPLSFNCGNLGKQIQFPFTSSDRQDCGLLAIHGCGDEDPNYPKFIKHAENWFEVVELGQSNTFTIKDQEVHDLLLSGSCGVLTHSLPFSDPANSVFASYQLENNFTVFECNNTHNLNPIESYSNYSFVNCSKVFYRKSLNNLEGDDDDEASRFLNSYCKRVEVPIAENIEVVDNSFVLLSENITIRVQLSPQCDTCHYVHGGQCQDSKGRFYCAKGMV